MNNVIYKRLATVLITAWFVLALSASALHMFTTAPGRPPVALGLVVLTPLIGFIFWFLLSAEFRQFALSINPRTLTFIQSWRIAGLTFLVLYAAGLLPGIFALPAGLGDIAIGATAPLAAIRLVSPKHRRSFILWQMLGILDLVMAVSLGILTGMLESQGGSTSIMTALPMSLIPTFAVPLLLILHILCIAQAMRWRESSPSQIGVLSPTST